MDNKIVEKLSNMLDTGMYNTVIMLIYCFLKLTYWFINKLVTLLVSTTYKVKTTRFPPIFNAQLHCPC